MDTDNDSGELPARRLSINQVVAWNIAYYRQAAGLTQEELGERLGGRPKAAVSADERSFDGKRTREFDAHTLVNLAAALGVPIGALFLPPVDDGTEVRYLYRVHDQADDSTMADLMAAVMPDSDNDTRVMDAYRDRLTDAVRRYMDPGWSDEVARWMQDMTGPEIRAERAARLRTQREMLLDLAAELGGLAEALEDKPEEDVR